MKNKCPCYSGEPTECCDCKKKYVLVEAKEYKKFLAFLKGKKK